MHHYDNQKDVRNEDYTENMNSRVRRDRRGPKMSVIKVILSV